MIVFGNDQFRLMGIIYCAMPMVMAGIGFIVLVIFGAIYNLAAK